MKCSGIVDYQINQTLFCISAINYPVNLISSWMLYCFDPKKGNSKIFQQTL